MGEGNLYLKLIRFVQGETSLLGEIGAALAHHLFTVPVYEVEDLASDNVSITFHAYAFSWCGHTVVPVFLSQKSFRAWEENMGEHLGCVEVFGADLFTTIPAEYQILFEPFSTVEMLLSDEFLELLEEKAEEHACQSEASEISSVEKGNTEGWYRPNLFPETRTIELSTELSEPLLPVGLKEETASTSSNNEAPLVRRSTTILQNSAKRSTLLNIPKEPVTEHSLLNPPAKGEKRSFLKFLRNAK